MMRRPGAPWRSRDGGDVGRKIGLPTATALVVGNMIGSGIFLLPSSLAPYGATSIVGWVLTAGGSLGLALVFARLARLVPKVGGVYAYTREAYGDFPGFWIAWGYWISQWTGNAAISVAFSSYLSVFVPALRGRPAVSAAVAAAAVWVLTAVNLRGVRSAGNVQVVTTILKLLPLVAIGTVGLLWLQPSRFVPFNPSGEPTWSAITTVATLTLWSFLGLESATVPADDVRDPARTIARATVIGTAVSAAVYVASTVAVMGAMPREALQGSEAPFAEAARAMWGSWAYYAVGLGAVVSCFGALNGWLLLVGQVAMAAAQDGLFPRRFAARSSRGVPAFATVVGSLLITALLALYATGARSLQAVFHGIILLAVLSALIPYAFCALAPLLIGRARGHAIAVRDLVLCGGAFAYAVWATYGAGAQTVMYGLLLLLAGIPVYVWMRRERTLSETGAPPDRASTAG